MSLHVNQLIGFGAGGGAPIEFVGGAFTGSSGGNITETLAINTGLTGGISSAAQSGDLVVACFAMGSDTDNTLTITDGTNNYTLIGSELYKLGEVSSINLRVAYKFITNDTTITFSGGSGGGDEAKVRGAYVFRNVSVSTPIDVTTTTATGNSAPPNPPSITPVTAGAFIVCVGASGWENGLTSFTSPDLTDLIGSSGNSSGRDAVLSAGHKPDWTSGAFDAAAWTGGDETDSSWGAITFALRPA